MSGKVFFVEHYINEEGESINKEEFQFLQKEKPSRLVTINRNWGIGQEVSVLAVVFDEKEQDVLEILKKWCHLKRKDYFDRNKFKIEVNEFNTDKFMLF